VLTLPAAAGIGALTYGLTRVFGTGAAGPIVVSVLILAVIGAVFARRVQQGSPITAESR
jgi:PiT family inorganic phosphate transporter